MAHCLRIVNFKLTIQHFWEKNFCNWVHKMFPQEKSRSLLVENFFVDKMTKIYLLKNMHTLWLWCLRWLKPEDEGRKVNLNLPEKCLLKTSFLTLFFCYLKRFLIFCFLHPWKLVLNVMDVVILSLFLHAQCLEAKHFYGDITQVSTRENKLLFVFANNSCKEGREGKAAMSETTFKQILIFFQLLEIPLLTWTFDGINFHCCFSSHFAFFFLIGF